MFISSIPKLTTLIATSMLLNYVEVHSNSATALFSKVQGRSPGSSCMLNTVQTPKGFNLLQACSTRCMTTPNCRFFCTRAEKHTCTFWSAYVAVRWSGPKPEDPEYDACYTSWGSGKDVVQTNSTTTYSSVFDNNYLPILAIDGWACGKCRYFCTKKVAGSYFQIDLGQITKVEDVIAVPESNIYFVDISVHLGNNTSFNSDTLYGAFPRPAASMSSNALTLSGPSRSGRYLTLYSPKQLHFGICEVQVISA